MLRRRQPISTEQRRTTRSVYIQPMIPKTLWVGAHVLATGSGARARQKNPIRYNPSPNNFAPLSTHVVHPQQIVLTKPSRVGTYGFIAKQLQQPYQRSRHYATQNNSVTQDIDRPSPLPEANLIPLALEMSFLACVLIFLIYSIYNEKEAQNPQASDNNLPDKLTIQQVLLKALPPHILKQRTRAAFMLEEAILLSNTNLKLAAMVKEYIAISVIPKLNEVQFDKLSFLIFSNDQVDYAVLCINELKSRFKNIDKQIVTKTEERALGYHQSYVYQVYLKKNSALVIAAQYRCKNMIHLLLDEGADIHNPVNRAALAFIVRSYLEQPVAAPAQLKPIESVKMAI